MVVVEAAEDASQLEQRARSLHAEGDYRGSLEAYEAAFVAYRDAGELLAAARAARTVGWFRGWVFGEWAVYQGWAGRASALLEQAGDARAEGWIRYEEARRGNDLESQRRLYREAIDLARSTGDTDLECDAIASLGMMLVFSGLVDEGMAHLDQALAAICGGGVRELPVIEGCLCGLLHACERTHDVERAQQWLGAADEVIRRGNLLAVAGYCRGTTQGSSSPLDGGPRPSRSFELLWSCSKIASLSGSRLSVVSLTCVCAKAGPKRRWNFSRGWTTTRMRRCRSFGFVWPVANLLLRWSWWTDCSRATSCLTMARRRCVRWPWTASCGWGGPTTRTSTASA